LSVKVSKQAGIIEENRRESQEKLAWARKIDIICSVMLSVAGNLTGFSRNRRAFAYER